MEQKSDWQKTGEDINKAVEDYFEAPADVVYKAHEFKTVTMEEAIKALIEKYEGMEERVKKLGAASEDMDLKRLYGAQEIVFYNMVADLKQLLNKE